MIYKHYINCIVGIVWLVGDRFLGYVLVYFYNLISILHILFCLCCLCMSAVPPTFCHLVYCVLLLRNCLLIDLAMLILHPYFFFHILIF